MKTARSHSITVDVALFLPLLALCYWFVVSAMAKQWLDDPNYNHGLFIIPMAVVLGWKRRKKLLENPAETSAFGYVFILAGGMIYLAGIAAAELFTMRLSLVVMFFGLVLATQGARRTRILLLPCCFLLMMIPLPYIFYYKMTFPLQLMSSRLTAAVLSSLGMPVMRSGNIIHLEHYTLEVVTACSGLRSIMTLGAMAIFVSDFFQFGKLVKLFFVLLVLPIAVLVNTVRLATTAVVSAVASPEAADSFMHDLSGVLVFLLGLLCLIIVGVVIEWIVARKSARRPQGS